MRAHQNYQQTGEKIDMTKMITILMGITALTATGNSLPPCPENSLPPCPELSAR